MKKLFALLLALMMIFSLAACGNKDNPDPSGSNTPETSQNGKNKDKKNDENVDPMQKMLNRAGLKFDDIKPAEQTFDMVFDEGDDELTFYMEKDTERDAPTYMRKIQDACKSVSDDGKLYKPDFNFFMGTERVEYPPLPSDEDINSGMMYMMQFGYLKDGQTVTVTAARITDMHPTRSDDVYYPVYTLTFGF